jgi:hypothetical protein
MGPIVGFKPIPHAIAVCLLVAGVGFGCDPGAKSNYRQGEDLDTREDACGRDADCSSYLRCVKGVCSVPPAVSGEPIGEPASVSILRAPGEDADESVAQFNVELAVEPAQRRRGLMHRRSMASGWGMLFVYPNEAMRSFWMKNTYIALDMVFADRTGRIVHILERVEPMTTAPRSSNEPSQYVLELKAGAADEHGLSRGMYLRVSNVPEALEPNR